MMIKKLPLHLFFIRKRGFHREKRKIKVLHDCIFHLNGHRVSNLVRLDARTTWLK